MPSTTSSPATASLCRHAPCRYLFLQGDPGTAASAGHPGREPPNAAARKRSESAAEPKADGHDRPGRNDDGKVSAPHWATIPWRQPSSGHGHRRANTPVSDSGEPLTDDCYVRMVDGFRRIPPAATERNHKNAPAGVPHQTQAGAFLRPDTMVKCRWARVSGQVRRTAAMPRGGNGIRPVEWAKRQSSTRPGGLQLETGARPGPLPQFRTPPPPLPPQVRHRKTNARERLRLDALPMPSQRLPATK